MFASESSRLRGRDGGWVYHWILREVSRDSPLDAVATMAGPTTFQDGDGPACGVSKVMTHLSPNWGKYLLETLGFQGNGFRRASGTMHTNNRFALIGGWTSGPESCCGSMTDWRVKAVILVLAFCGLAPGSFSQGVLQITFDGPPAMASGTGVTVTNYYEGGMFFRALPGSRGFSRLGPPTDPRVPNNGTAFLRAAISQSLMFSFTNGSTFEMLSVELAGYSSVVPDATIQFVGYRADGSTVMTNVDRHGIVFDTMYFGQEFSDLTRVEIPNSLWSLDNLAVSVPEPSAGALWVTGLACGAFVFGRSRKVVSAAEYGKRI